MNKQENHNTTQEKLEQAYHQMVERAHNMAEKAEESTLATREALAKAKETAVELGELTLDEAEKIGAYLKRDLEDAAQFLAKTGRSLKDWLRFDLDLIEDRLSDAMANMVDQTQLELAKLKALAESTEPVEESDTKWHTGEVTGPGTLACESCGRELHYHKPGRIPPCPKCHATLFMRVKDET